MHWSGVVRIVAIVAAACAWTGTEYGLGLSWYFGLAAALVTYLLLPVIIGIAWGMSERDDMRREMDAAVEKAKRDEPPY